MAVQAEIKALGTILGVEGELDVRLGGGPVSIRLASVRGIDFPKVWQAISDELKARLGFGLPDLSGPWSKLIQGLDTLIVTPALWISPSGNDPSKLALSLQLEFKDPIEIGGSTTWGPFKIEMTPRFKVLALIFSYDSAGGGLDVKAKVSNPTTPVPGALRDRRLLASPPAEKTQLVSFPFPVPAQQAVPLIKFHYIGIGQRVGPNPNVTSDDPLLAIFEELETQLVGDDPAQVLTSIANDFYHPDRGWFIGLDVELRGFRVMVLFNDPVMYGVRISVAMLPLQPFSGLLFEILYQRLSPNLGVYYGALTLPYFLRRIVIQGVVLILPGFAIWIYTNGDFRVNVGWPLGDSSIAVQVGPLVGAAGFYFAKLRSGDNPAVQPTVSYNPILAFGIGLSLYVKQSFNASIFSATLDVSLTTTLQGLLAWKEGRSIAGVPDHYWFAGTAGLSVLIQGTVDFSIIKASVTISFTAFAGVAFETGYATLITVSASVSVDVSLKIVFFTIHLSFQASISHTFTIGSGTPASVDGPLDPDLSGIIHPTLEALCAAEASARAESMLERLAARPGERPRARAFLAAAPPPVIDVMFTLQPTAVYADDGSATFAVVATLMVQAPAPAAATASPGTPFETLMQAFVRALLDLSTPGLKWSQRFHELAVRLGSGGDAPLGDWAAWRRTLEAFLATCTFAIAEAKESPGPRLPAALIPMLDVLQLSYVDAHGQAQEVDFDTYDPVPAGYPARVNAYYADVGGVGEQAEREGDAAPRADLRNSFAAFVQADYYLMQARQAADVLWKAALRYEGGAAEEFHARAFALEGDAARAWDLVELTATYVARISGADELDTLLQQFDYASAAGLGSRYLLNGLQLPTLAGTPAATAPLFDLTGQFYAVASGAASAQGVLALSPTADVPPGHIVFEGGSPSSVTCTLPLPGTVPPVPAPEWKQALAASGGANGTITLAQLPGVMPGALAWATRNQVAWSASGAARTILPLPQPLLSRLAADAGRTGFRLSVQPTPPPDSNRRDPASPPAPPLPSSAALLIRLSLSQVPANLGANVGGGGSPSGSPAAGTSVQFIPFVYEVSGADEATRDLIYAALQGPLEHASLALLYSVDESSGSPLGPVGLRSEELAPTVLLAKTNLSTLNQVPGAGAEMAARYAALRGLGGDAALLTDCRAFLRLLWEVSVVNAPGFFLFYQDAAGQDLPSSLFTDIAGSSGTAAQFDVMLRFGRAAEDAPALPAAANCVFLEQGGPDRAVYLGLLDAQGATVPRYEPTYAAGNVGFSLLWQRPQQSDGPVPVDDLYHLVQYCVRGGGGYAESVWSLPVGPSQDNGPHAALASARDWTYVQTVAASRFRGSPQANRYDVIDQPIDVGFRVIDLYGDVLPQQADAALLPLYQDPLITIGQWPGALWSWRVVPGTGGAAQLLLNVTFDPDSVVAPSSPDSGDATVRRQWEALLARYLLVLDQLLDPGTSVAMTSSLDGGAGAPLAEDALTARLVAVADAIAASIRDGLASSPPVVEGLTQTIAVALPFAGVVALEEDIVPVRFAIGLSRDPSRVDPEARLHLPAAVSVIYAVAPEVVSGAADGGSPATQFATQFEAAFTGFDGAAGLLKLAQRAGVQNGQDAPQVDAYWAVRWSATAGIAVAFTPTPAFFALAPLSRVPMSGTFGGRTWSGVDLDAWARTFLNAYDSFLAPRLAVAIGILDAQDGTQRYQALMETKEHLAGTIVKGVRALFEDQPAGDRAAAAARLEQALLSTLGSAFTVSSIVQVPAEVALSGSAAPPSPARAPRLYGSVGPDVSSSPAGARQYTLTPGELDLVPGPSWMTTLLTVANPEGAAAISMPLGYQVSYLQHDFRLEEKFLDYVPSSWLKFALPAGEPLQMTVAADATLPVPLIFMPTSPSLLGQQASGAPIGSGGSPGGIAQEIREALRWDFAVSLAPNWAAQDTLGLDLTYNLTPVELAALVRDPLRAARQALADALATFVTWYEAESGSFGAIVAEAFPSGSPAPSPGRARDLVDTFARLARSVQGAWEGLFAPPVQELDALEILVDSFSMQSSAASPAQIALAGRAQDGSNPRYWPSVNGMPYGPATAARAPSGWWIQPQTFPRAARLDLLVGDLEIDARQSGLAAARIVRNANLIEGLVTHSDFVYETEPVAFKSSVVPLVHRSALATLAPAPSLTATLAEVLRAIGDTGAGLATSLRVQAGFTFALSAAGASRLTASEAILLADGLSVGGSPDDAGRVARRLAAGIAAWYVAAPRPTAGAQLVLALTLFGVLGSKQLPLVQIDAIPIDVSAQGAAWWRA